MSNMIVLELDSLAFGAPSRGAKSPGAA
ncbi:MAG: hypothetical protein QOF95_1917, partial [Pseudonocardiales bacterium]|nr:hypothetical protein [Pseudonocardiales bacterium]